MRCGSPTSDPDQAGTPRPRSPRPAQARLGPDLRPSRALPSCRGCSIARLLARGRSFAQLRKLLAGSDAVVSPGAASDSWASAGHLRWLQQGCALGHRRSRRSAGHGLGRRVIEELLHTPPVVGWNGVYLLTTKSAGFYRQLGFQDANPSNDGPAPLRH